MFKVRKSFVNIKPNGDILNKKSDIFDCINFKNFFISEKYIQLKIYGIIQNSYLS